MHYIILILLFVSLSHAEEQPVISVLDLEPAKKLDEDYHYIPTAYSEFLIQNIINRTSFKVVQRSALRQIIQEQSLAMAGLMNKANDELAGILGADYLLKGRLYEADDLMAQCQLHDIKKGEVVFSWGQEIDEDELMSAAAAFADTLGAFFKRKKDAPKPEDIPKDQVKKFSRVIKLQDINLLDSAKALMESLGEENPKFIYSTNDMTEVYKKVKDFRKLRQTKHLAKLYRDAEVYRSYLAEPTFQTYADIVKAHQTEMINWSVEQRDAFNKRHELRMRCSSRTLCVMAYLQQLMDIASYQEGEMSREEMAKKSWADLAAAGDQAIPSIQDNDPNLSELRYLELLGLRWSEQWEAYIPKAEFFMMNHSEHRLIEFVEDFYTEAKTEIKLKKDAGKK